MVSYPYQKDQDGDGKQSMKKELRHHFPILKLCVIWIFIVLFTGTAASCGWSSNSIYEEDPRFSPAFQVTEGVGIAEAQLDAEEKILYGQFLSSLENWAAEISGGLEHYSDRVIEKVYSYVLKDHPEFFWLQDGYSLSTQTGLLSRTKTLLPVYIIGKQEISVCKQNVQNIRDEILVQTASMDTDYEKLLYIHDSIVRTVQYDTDAYTDIDTAAPSRQTLESTTLYGALVNKKAICGGYAKAFQYLAEAAGIRCTTVTGRNKEGEAHLWNLVVLDGDCYYVDITGDDPVFTGPEEQQDPNEIFYNYFCITEAELLKTHVFGADNIVLPACTAVKYDYFVFHQLYLDSYSLEGAAGIIRQAVAAGQRTAYLKFQNGAGLEQAVRELFQERKIFDILADAGCEPERASYSKDEEHNIITVNF